MESTKKVSLFYKIISLLSVIRGYNILVLVIAQYLASIYIFSPKKSVTTVVFDLHLFFVVFATVCVVAGGYIINNFYDVKADKINRPYKAGLDSFVKQETTLSIYFLSELYWSSCRLFSFMESCLVFFSIYIWHLVLFSQIKTVSINRFNICYITYNFAIFCDFCLLQKFL